MAASRRGQPELHVRLPPRSPGSGTGLTTGTSLAAPQSDLPPISALFLIEFDVKAGYTLSWKAALPDIELEGVVEYKSLPSGLHTVKDDLIYFVHEGFAGLSAFVNAPVQDSEVRNARMIAVGVLVPLSYGRLGRAWRHAEGLKEIASKVAVDGKDTSLLEQYWAKNQAHEEATQQDAMASKESLESSTVTFQEQPKPPRKQGHTRNRSGSDGGGLLAPGHKLSSFHPAWSLLALLDTFGPLIFPIQRAALLRKRILISCHVPVQQVCDFVYDISILSNIPLPTFENLPAEGPPHRLRPLFTIGVHDIPSLMEDAKSKRPGPSPEQDSTASSGWIACTTDSILAMKDTLWDVLITMPPPHASAAKEHVWPTVEYPGGTAIKATQRDLRRYKALRAGLFRMQGHSNIAAESPESPPTTPRVLSSPQKQTQDDPLLDEAEKIVEPLSWTALAYSGFMWWASAGEQARSDEAEEASHDASLLADAAYPNMTMPMPRSGDLSASLGSLGGRRTSSAGGQNALLPPDEARAELAIITYFHRLTSQLLTRVSDIVESNGDSDDAGSNADDDPLLGGGEEEDEDEGEYDARGVRITREDLRLMGLDRWSPSDAEFVKEVVDAYFGRAAYIEGQAVEVCGVRVC
ncbi:hypothetical protein JX265_002683 [Neoarthrinium moseri]|uniref:DUF4484 domain-containing protein n=1 Tax=Neoarthrinium moseri TaxID=1658444 RepID=A0A9Q0AQM0_9PEZI|nr:uncharacterized protein JN550_000495 [Neoarthrinium moseri]KAI1842711.1 hypothetical protein JX266_011173 [Neoarthrinium moseri]KAI1878313.1 hypothetical protein JN550_000495 [Neoarthrinium moseri]KAI1879729.1 hypothetical protein JX265_002683 [Neoarthrinium moseri]